MQIWIVGAGSIAQEYAKVLTALGYNYVVIGRGQDSADAFKLKTGHDVVTGGLKSFLETVDECADFVIVATPISELSSNTIDLLNFGVKNILCEKPGFLYPQECDAVASLAVSKHANAFIAYNRRFYSSVLEAERIIDEDGGIKSFNFEFTEWGHVIEKLNYPEAFFANWFYANSSHVVDLAFFMGGKPSQISSFTAGELPWHRPAVFAGAGISTKGALFSYQANWDAPGRWSVELLTERHRLYLRPMERLQIQNKGSVTIDFVEFDDRLDREFKPGFYMETKAFLERDFSRLCSVNEQAECIGLYNRIRGLALR